MGVKQSRAEGMSRRDDASPKTQQLTFRAEDEQRAFADARAQEDNVNRSEIVREAWDVYQALYELLGEDWYEVQKRARIARQSMGATLAALVRAALEGRSNNKK